MDHRGVAGNVTEFDGNLGLVIGAGGGSLTLFDAVRKYGGKPANYCEIGGNPSVAKAAGLAKLVLSKPGVDKIAVMMSDRLQHPRRHRRARRREGLPRARLRPGARRSRSSASPAPGRTRASRSSRSTASSTATARCRCTRRRGGRWRRSRGRRRERGGDGGHRAVQREPGRAGRDALGSGRSGDRGRRSRHPRRRRATAVTPASTKWLQDWGSAWESCDDRARGARSTPATSSWRCSPMVARGKGSGASRPSAGTRP